MNPDGQVYADFDGTAPEADKQRFLTEERHALFVARNARRVMDEMKELERMLSDAEGG